MVIGSLLADYLTLVDFSTDSYAKPNSKRDNAITQFLHVFWLFGPADRCQVPSVKFSNQD